MGEVKSDVASSVVTRTTRALLIVNPAAWMGTTTTTDAIVATLKSVHIQADIALTTEEEHGAGLAKQAIADQYDMVIAAGGDGTIHEVACGLIGSGVALGILPLGTMNNLARSLHIPEDLEAACVILEQGRRQAIDVGLMDNRPFLEAVSVGSEAPLFALGESNRHSGFGGAIRGIISGLRLLNQSRRQSIIVELDGHRRRVKARQITICNAPYFGLGFSAAPDASMSDGLLDVVIERYSRRRDVLRHYWSIALGQREPPSRVHVHQARRVRIFAPEPWPVAIDGVQAGTTPTTVSVAPHAITVIGAATTAPDPTPPAPPIIRALRAILPQEHNDPKVVPPAEQLQRWHALVKVYWLLSAILGAAALITRSRHWWPFRTPANETPLPPLLSERRDLLLWRGLSMALAGIFARLRLPVETTASVAGEGSRLLAWIPRLLHRRWSVVPEPDEEPMRAVASIGVLTAGLWVTRRATWRRNFFLAALTALGGWFISVQRPRRPTKTAQRDALALGAGLGIIWLGGTMTAIAQGYQRLFTLTKIPATAEAHDTHHRADKEVAPPPSNARLSRAIVPVAVQQPLQRGDIVLFGPDGTFGARMIDLFTLSHYHHVAIYDGEGMVVEAMPGGVRRYLLGNRNVTGVRPHVSTEQRLAAADWARKHIGDAYDTPELLLIAFDRVFPGLRLGSASASRFSCAVFIADAYLHAGVDLLPGHRWQDLVPGDFIALIDTAPRI